MLKEPHHSTLGNLSSSSTCFPVFHLLLSKVRISNKIAYFYPKIAKKKICSYHKFLGSKLFIILILQVLLLFMISFLVIWLQAQNFCAHCMSGLRNHGTC